MKGNVGETRKGSWGREKDDDGVPCLLCREDSSFHRLRQFPATIEKGVSFINEHLSEYQRPRFDSIAARKGNERAGTNLPDQPTGSSSGPGIVLEPESIAVIRARDTRGSLDRGRNTSGTTSLSFAFRIPFLPSVTLM